MRCVGGQVGFGYASGLCEGKADFVRLFRGPTINKFIGRSENIQVIVTPMSAY